MSHIFIAHHESDAAFAQQLRQNLDQAGFTVSAADPTGGPIDAWWQKTTEAIAQSAALIVILSSRARASRWVQRELLYAESLEKPIFPVLAEGTRWDQFADVQVIDATAGPTFEVTAQLAQAIRAFTPSESERVQAPPARMAPQRPLGRASSRRLWVTVIGVIGILTLIACLIYLFGSADGDSAPQDVGVIPTQAPTQINASATQAASAATRDALTNEAMAAATFEPTRTITGTPTSLSTATPTEYSSDAPEPTATNLPTRLPPTQPPRTPLPTPDYVAQQVEGTVAVFMLTEQSYLSPAEAAELAAIIVENTDDNARTQSLLIALNIVLTVLAVGILSIAIFMARGIGFRRSSRAHPAHPAHPEGTKPVDSVTGKHQVFISSSDRDRDWVALLVNQLDREGFEVWWYAKDALGKPFGDEIVRAIFTAKVFAVIISPDSMTSKHVEEEIRIADRYDKPIVNILYRQTERRLYGLAKGSEIDFTDEITGDMSYDEKQQTAMGYLLNAIDYHLGLSAKAPDQPDAPSDAHDESDQTDA